MSSLAITSLSKSYGAFKVFEKLDLAVDAGEIVVILNMNFIKKLSIAKG